MVLGLDSRSSRWLMVYFPVSWLTEFGHGLVNTVVGPTQPYLARNTGVDIATINLVWTFGFLGFMVGSLATGFVFKRYVKSDRAKLMFLSASIFTGGAVMMVLPFTSSFPLLVGARLVQYLALGSFCTADASLIVFLLGPDKSRPFTMIFHASIGMGFLAATLLVRPFLPDDSSDQQDVCGASNKSSQHENMLTDYGNISSPRGSLVSLSDYGNVSSTSSLRSLDQDDGLVPDIAWPFIISGSWCMIFSLGFLLLTCLPFTMPRFYEEDEKEEDKPEKDIKYWKLFLALLFLFYFVSCGIERIYQPMAYTFGICGPLALQPSQAVVIDSCYNGGFMGGRILSAFVAMVLKPRNMVLASLVLCVGASILLCFVASKSLIGLYAGTAVLGFFVSWQFGSCFSWVAKKKNITGRLSTIFFIGCGCGSLVTPPLSGYFFTNLGAMSIIYLTLSFCILQCIIFFILWILSRPITGSSTNSLTAGPEVTSD